MVETTGTSVVLREYGRVDVGNNNKVRIALCKFINEFHGKVSEYPYLDVRQIYLDKNEQEKTGKGFTISIKDGSQSVDEIIESLTKAREDLFESEDSDGR